MPAVTTQAVPVRHQFVRPHWGAASRAAMTMFWNPPESDLADLDAISSRPVTGEPVRPSAQPQDRRSHSPERVWHWPQRLEI